MEDSNLLKIRQHINSSKKVTRSFFLTEELFGKSRRKMKKKTIDELIPKSLAEKARKVMTEDQLEVMTDAVVYDIVNEDTLPEKISKIVDGWKGAPKDVDGRIKRILAMCVNSKHIKSGRGSSEEKPREILSYNFDDRIAKLKSEYKLDVADEQILRTMVWAEIELERMMTGRTGPASKEKILMVSKTVELVKTCMETLKLSRRQRHVTNDDETDKELNKRFKERQGDSEAASVEVTKRADQAKSEIKRFSDDDLKDMVEDEDVCDKCFDPSCDGNCE